MAKVEQGSVALVIRGHEAGRYQAVIALDADGWPLMADGKRRKRAAPKRRNPKHIRPTGHQLEEHMLTSDRQLRVALHPFNYGQNAVSEE